jgi:hypothetical protein
MRGCQRAPAAAEGEARSGHADFSDKEEACDVDAHKRSPTTAEEGDIAAFQYTHCSRYRTSSGRSSGRLIVRVCDSLKPVKEPDMLEAQPSPFVVDRFEPKAARKKGERLVRRSAWM